MLLCYDYRNYVTNTLHVTCLQVILMISAPIVTLKPISFLLHLVITIY